MSGHVFDFVALCHVNVTRLLLVGRFIEVSSVFVSCLFYTDM